MLHLPFLRDRMTDDLVLGRLGKYRFSPLFRVPLSARSAHLYVVGLSGKGKSKFLEWCLYQDIAAGHGCGLIDPYSLLVDDLLRLLLTQAVLDASHIRDRVRVANMPTLMPETPDGFFMFLLQMGLAQREVDVLKQRTADGMEAKLRAGGWPHKAPEGYVNRESQVKSK